MRFLLSVLITAVLSYAFERFFSWYSVAFAAFITAYLFNLRGLAGFMAGALGVGLLWLGYAWIIDFRTHSILTDKMAKLFGLTEPAFLLVITFLVGILVGGFAAWSGQSLKKAFEKKRRSSYYI